MTAAVADDQLSFGKYRGQTVGDIAESDPAYLLWAHDQVDHFALSDEMLALCEQNEEARDICYGYHPCDDLF